MKDQPATTVNVNRKPIFGIGSIVIPIAAFGIGWAWASTNHGHEADDSLFRFFVVAGTIGWGTTFGTIFALIALLRQERLRHLAVAGLITNGLALALLLFRRIV